jgi:hypothetical protein
VVSRSRRVHRLSLTASGFDVFYRGPNGHLWTSWWDGGQWWSAPTDLDGVGLSSEPAAITGGPHGIDLFYAARISIFGPAGGRTHQEVRFGARLRT